MPRTHQRRAMLVIGLVACAVFLVSSGTAVAHPWGPPPEAVVAGDRERVTVEWRAEPDDVITLGIDLGLLDPVQLDWDWEGPQARPENADEPLLPPSERLHTYLLDHIRVLQDGVVCDGRVEPFGDFVVDGATTVHVCPKPVAVVDLEISMLHDLHEAYRTFADSQGTAQPRQAMFTPGTSRHAWAFGDAAGAESAGAWIQAMAGVVLAVAVAALAAYRRRRRRRPRDRAGSRSDTPHGELVRTSAHGLAPLGVVAAAGQWRFGWLETEFLKLIDLEGVGVALGVTALITAFGVGAAHALAPGHGKALIATYLVGTRGRPRDAVALGGIVAGMHSASVLVFGGVLLTTVRFRGDVGELLPWMSVAAGLLVTAVGAGLVIRQARPRAAQSMVAAGHGAVHHGHDRNPQDQHHSHHHGHRHALPEGVRPFSRRGIVALGVSGGLLPSPSALLVLATAILLGRAVFGLLLVAAFSAGLAATLTAFGLTAVTTRTVVERRATTSPTLARLTAVVPLASSVAVLVGGFMLTTLALVRL